MNSNRDQFGLPCPLGLGDVPSDNEDHGDGESAEHSNVNGYQRLQACVATQAQWGDDE